MSHESQILMFQAQLFSFHTVNASWFGDNPDQEAVYQNMLNQSTTSITQVNDLVGSVRESMEGCSVNSRPSIMITDLSVTDIAENLTSLCGTAQAFMNGDAVDKLLILMSLIGSALPAEFAGYLGQMQAHLNAIMSAIGTVEAARSSVLYKFLDAVQNIAAIASVMGVVNEILDAVYACLPPESKFFIAAETKYIAESLLPPEASPQDIFNKALDLYKESSGAKALFQSQTQALADIQSIFEG